MNESLTNFRKRCLDAALDLLWRQWCSLGVAGHSRPAESGTIIDPEALLLGIGLRQQIVGIRIVAV